MTLALLLQGFDLEEKERYKALLDQYVQPMNSSQSLTTQQRLSLSRLSTYPGHALANVQPS